MFNAERDLRAAIESIRRQSYTAWELIVVDDGSTDATPYILRSFTQIEPRLRTVPMAHHGIVAALNAGIRLSNAAWIARMDADDLSDSERLREQLLFLEAHPNLGLVGSLVRFGGDAELASGFAEHVSWLNSVQTAHEISCARFIESPFAHPTVIFRRDLVMSFGGYREGDFPEDYELWLRWLEAGVQMAKVPKVLVTWNDLPTRLSRVDPRYRFDSFYRCKAEYLARWLKGNLDADKELLIWGAGRLTRRRSEHLRAYGINWNAYIDIDQRKIGRTIGGLNVLSPETIPPPKDCFVLGYVAKRGAREFARAHLQGRGFVEGENFLFAA